MGEDKDIFGRPISKGIIGGKTMSGRIGSGQTQFDAKGNLIPQMPVFDSNGNPTPVAINQAVKIVTTVAIASFLLVFVGVGAIFWFVFSLLSGPSEVATEYLKTNTEVRAESANFHYGNINNNDADLVGNYTREGKSFPVWVRLEKSGEDWVVVDFANQPPSEVIDSMNDDVEFDDF